ncbi:MAG TPA: excisionase family DNA-binding protein [Pseudonocardiaceae bacterium]|nr:excisionase family DNA-binding protein [Pseudonocardiaceae bacterium]
MSVPVEPPDRQPRTLLSVEQAAARLAIGRTLMFALLRDQIVDSVTVGRRRLVPADAVDAYVARLSAARTGD